MCGIAGLINPEQIPLSEIGGLATKDLDALSRGMLSLLHHRGPDENGRLLSDHGFIGNTRLSIVDIEGGTQPISNEDDTVWVVYNGEIYDVDEHIAGLRAKGHRFRTRSDTEILVHLYEEHAEDLVGHLNGEYAFCLHDIRKNVTLLVRDPFGTKPIHFTQVHQSAWLFSSEIRPLLWAMGTRKPALSAAGIAQTLQGWAPVPPDTCFDGILQIPPGTVAAFSGRGVKFRQFYGNLPSNAFAGQQLLPLLDKAVRRRLKADVPVGVYLSGGLDSAIVTCLASENSNHPIKSFSVEFEDKQFDESSDQKRMIDFAGTEHCSLRINHEAIREHLLPAVLSAECAVFRSAFVPMFLLSKMVRDSGIKVVLTGEGADELFGGYDIYRELKILRFWARQPSSSIRPKLLSRLYPYLPQFRPQNLRFVIPFYRSFLKRMEEPFAGHAVRWGNYASTSLILRRPPPDPVKSALLQTLNGLADMSVEEQCRQAEILTLLHGYLLSTQGDRMASAHSVEVRIPFLDVEVAGFAFQHSVNEFISGLREKRILYESFAAKLPKGILRKRKTPFLAPDSEAFFSDPTGDWRDYFTHRCLNDAEIFDFPEVEKFLRRVELQFSKTGDLARRDNTVFFVLLSSLVLRQELGNCPGVGRARIEMKKDARIPADHASGSGGGTSVISTRT